MSNPDTYLLTVHKPYRDEHPRPINATIVHALTLLNTHLPQPDAGLIYRCLTEFPGRNPGCIVPVSTLSFELDGGRLWADIGDWDAVTTAIVELARARGCDAAPLGLPPVPLAALANGPTTKTTLYHPDGTTQTVGAPDRTAILEELTRHVRTMATEQAFWPGDSLTTPPSQPARLPYQPWRSIDNLQAG